MNPPIRPEFIRLPKSRQNCPYTGYSRSGLANLCVPSAANDFRPPVPAKCDRKRGNLRGTWYIPYDALIAYIQNLPTPGLKPPASGEFPAKEAREVRSEAGSRRGPRAPAGLRAATLFHG